MMSSSDDEFFDAEDAFPSANCLSWEYREERTAGLGSEAQENAQRRIKVESLKRSLERGEDPSIVSIGASAASTSTAPPPESGHSSREALAALGGPDEDCLQYIKALTLDRRPMESEEAGPGAKDATTSRAGLSYDEVVRTATANQLRSSNSPPTGSAKGSGSPSASLRRPRTTSGRLLTDEEILSLWKLKNLDTGESFPLSSAGDLPRDGFAPLNPLDIQLLQRSALQQPAQPAPPQQQQQPAQQVSCGATGGALQSSAHSLGARSTEGSEPQTGVNGSHSVANLDTSVTSTTSKRRSGARLSQLFNRTRQVVKSVATRASEVLVPDDNSSEDEEIVGSCGIRLRASRSKKTKKEFFQAKLVQEMQHKHMGAVWTMKFSPCGRLLATGGQDKTVRIWVLKPFYRDFKHMQKRMEEQLPPLTGGGDLCANFDTVSLDQTSSASGKTDDDGSSSADEDLALNNSRRAPFRASALLVFRGHDGAVLDIAWSRNFFLLSSSMDRHVRLWHITRRETLCCFSHTDFVTAIVFHPKDDRYFLSGSMDGKLRLWNIPDKKVAHWVDPPPPPAPPGISASAASRTGGHQKCLITCANFCMDGGQRAVVGTYDGRVIFYTSDKLDYVTSVSVKSGTRTNRLCKITGIEVLPGEENKILVTSNDSRIRLYDLRDYHTLCKYRGHVNSSSQIKASFSHSGKYIICGSEDHFFYIWRTNHGVHRQSRFSRVRKDRNNFWEAIRAHEAVVTVAIFSPNPSLILDRKRRHRRDSYADFSPSSPSSSLRRRKTLGEVVVSADFNGCIRVFKNRMDGAS